MLDTPRVIDLIKRGEIDAVKDAVEQSSPDGCRTFDHSLFELYAAGRIDEAAAVANADSPNDLRLVIRRHRVASGAAAGAELPEPALRLAT